MTEHERPPCWPRGKSCPNNCAAQLYQRVIHNDTPLHGPWEGWKMRGAFLVSPGGERIRARELDRLLFRYRRFWNVM
jgi:hypothetical protein